MNDIKINIKVDDSQFKKAQTFVSKSMKNTIKQAKKLQSSISNAYKKAAKSAQESFKKLGDVGKKVATKIKTGFLTAAAGVAALAVATVKLSKDLADRNTVRALFASPADKQIFKDLDDIIAKTGIIKRTDMFELARSFKNVTGSARETQEAILLIADAHAITGTEATRLGEKFLDLRTKSQISLGDIDALAKDTGIDLREAFAGQEVIKYSEVLEATKKQLGLTILGQKALENASNDVDKKVNALSNAWTQFTDKLLSNEKVQKFVNESLDQLIDRILHLLDDLRALDEWFQKNSTTIKYVAAAIGGVLVLALGAVTIAAYNAAAAFIVANIALLPWILLAAGVGLAIKYLHDNFEEITEALDNFGYAAWDLFKTVLRTLFPLPALIIEKWDVIIAFFKRLPDDAIQFGKDFINGLINGIKSGITAIKNVVKAVASTITNTIKDVLKINSPSKVTEELGKNVAMGFNVGLDDKTIQRANRKVISKLRNDVLESGAPSNFSAESNSSAITASRIAKSSTVNNTNASNVNLTLNIGSNSSGLSESTLIAETKRQIEPILYDILTRNALKSAGQ